MEEPVDNFVVKECIFAPALPAFYQTEKTIMVISSNLPESSPSKMITSTFCIYLGEAKNRLKTDLGKKI